jgi:hypothetical protein
VGSLAECADALPLPGATWARRTGTFLQACSNAEQLRVWHEEILGISIERQNITICPQLPKHVLNVTMNTPFKNGFLVGHWHKGQAGRWVFELDGTEASIFFELEDNSVSWDLKAGQKVEIVQEGRQLKLTAFDSKGKVLGSKVSEADESFATFTALRAEIFKDLGFCEPKLAPNLNSLSIFHDPPLTR